jgi:uncharacterized protein
MNVRRTATILLLLVCFVPQEAFSSAAQDEPATREDVLHLFEVLRLRQQIELMVTAVKEQSKLLVQQTMEKEFPDRDPDFTAFMDRLMDELLGDIKVDSFLDDAVPIYQKHFTRADLQTLVAFYEGPVGRKFLDRTPAMMTEMMQVASQRQAQEMQAMMERVKQRVEEFLEEQERKKNRGPRGD